MLVSVPEIAISGKPEENRATSTTTGARVGLALRVAGPVEGAPRPLPALSSIKGVLFDIDGTLCNSDPLHLEVFRDMFAEIGFTGNGGKPIDEVFFQTHISGRHNPDITRELFPDWTEEQGRLFSEDKEARFRALAGNSMTTAITSTLHWYVGPPVISAQPFEHAA
eukprot:scaffold499485_cov32-Prasinocladus_malaysianus.AAC.1